MKKVLTALSAFAICAAVIFPPVAPARGLLPGDLLAQDLLSKTELKDAEQLIASLTRLRFVPDEVLIQFRPGASEAAQADARRKAGAIRKELIDTPPLRAAGNGELEVATVSPGPGLVRALRLLWRHPAVQFAEPNWIYQHSATSNDPYYANGSLWGMYGDATTPANQYGSQAGEAWAAGQTGDARVYVGIIDQGIQFDHPDLDANVWNNPYDPSDGIDNDGNGYVDDIHGWDFAGRNNTVYDGGTGATRDRHGTHVAGTIAAEGGNRTGVAGVSWNVTYISGKFLGPLGGTTADAVRAVDYFTDLKQRHGLNVVATNNSWSGGGFSLALLDAITRGAKADILFVAAAGNNGANNDAALAYPSNYDTTLGAGYDCVIAVASITKSGDLATSSNYGLASVDLGAPGSDIYSTLPHNSYGPNSGTSMAAPHVTGAAALYASKYPGASALAIKTAILDAARATPTPSLTGKTLTGGRLNVSLL